MRLINVHTLEMRSFSNAAIPNYAILSHRWLNDEQEISLQEYTSGAYQQRPGYKKIIDLCSFVRDANDRFRADLETSGRRHDPLDGVEWIWIDTCCIDKTSSADLSESINSMFEYYAKATTCVVYLRDVSTAPCGLQWCDVECVRCQATEEEVRSSEWFHRGWALQELVAPDSRIFASADWRVLGAVLHKKSQIPSTERLLGCIVEVTGIPQEVLLDSNELPATSVAQRLSWAANRTTTRVEDRSYSLFGLLGVNMPLLYGEGSRAWLRLQQEIIRTSSDESIFVWRSPDATNRRLLPSQPILAPSPECFLGCADVRYVPRFKRLPYSITNQGLEFKLRASTAFVTQGPKGDVYVIPLNCGTTSEGPVAYREARRMLVLERQPECGHYVRLGSLDIQDVPELCAAYAQRYTSRPNWKECADETVYIHISVNGCQSPRRKGHSAPIVQSKPHMARILHQLMADVDSSGKDNAISQERYRR